MLIRFIKTYYSYIILFLLVLTLFITNYAYNTTLIGWDNLQTDLNPVLGIKRSFFAVWEEYQSFGLTSGLSHAADIIRSIFIWFISFIIPSNLLRYFYHFLMILIGGIGIFKLLKGERFALLGAIFYILNYGTVQIFYLPWESFSTFFAFLPWEIWIFIKLIENIKIKKNWLFFLLINILASPQAYVQTIFIVYILCLSCITIGKYLENRSINILKNGGFIILTILFINAFWIFPQIYSILTRADIITSSKNNLLSTENVIYQNLEKGNLWNFLKMEGFYSELYGKNNTLLFLPWKEHFQNAYILIISTMLSTVFIVGICIAFFKKKSYSISFLFLFIVIAIALLSKVIFFEQINEFLRKQYLISQIFRSPFTKFVIPYSLVASYGLVIGVGLIYSLISKYFVKFPKGVILSLFIILIFIYSFPSFKGNYISSEMKINIPSAYEQTISYFKTQDKDKRIALMPEYTSLGWFNTKWGYNGSGFLWYGIEQPIVSRTFDVWSNESESYFWEIRSAIEARDTEKFEKILDKYDIDYLLYDKSLYPITGNAKSLGYDSIDSILSNTKKITLVKTWDFITIYKVNHPEKIDSFIKISSALPNIGPRITLTNDDTAYSLFGDYITNSKEPFQIYYPFLDLTTQTTITKKMWNIFDLPSEWIITSFLPFDSKPYSFTSPPSGKAEFNLYLNGSTKFILPFSTNLGKNTLTLSFPKIELSNFDLKKSELKNCSQQTGMLSKENKEKSIIITSNNGATACIAYSDQNLSQEYGYLVKVDNENIKDQRLFFYILDTTNEQSYVEERLKKDQEYSIIAPLFNQGLGYSFVFQNNSYQDISSINKLNSVKVYAMPYNQIKNLALQNVSQPIKKIYYKSDFQAEKINYFSYIVKGDSLFKEPNYLTLYQAFDSGWKAYVIKDNWIQNAFPFFFGTEIKKHVAVNNWANGWILNNEAIEQSKNRIVIVFLPQYLEYFGFLMLLILPVVFIVKRLK